MAPKKHTGPFIALLRGINVGGHNRVPMQELRALCAEIGWQDIQTYIQSGNLVFHAAGTASTLETALERALQQRFRLSISVIVRANAEWKKYIARNPFPLPSRQQPHRVMLAVSQSSPPSAASKFLQERAGAGEDIVQTGQVIWIYFREGAGKSKLTPALFDRAMGSPVTLRNWRTVLTLEKMTRPKPESP